MRKNLSLILIFITILLCYFSVFYFSNIKDESFVSVGPMGDAIGGLTAPIINLLSAILIYLSFREQLNANNIQKEALENEIKRNNTSREFDQIVSLLNDIKEEIKTLKLSHSTSVQGSETFHKINLLDKEDLYRDYFTELYKSIGLLSFICEKIETYKFSMRDEMVLFNKLELIFPYELSDPLLYYTETKDPFPNNNRIKLLRMLVNRSVKDYRKYYSKYQDRLLVYVDKIGQEEIARVTKKGR